MSANFSHRKYCKVYKLPTILASRSNINPAIQCRQRKRYRWKSLAKRPWIQLQHDGMAGMCDFVSFRRLYAQPVLIPKLMIMLQWNRLVRPISDRSDPRGTRFRASRGQGFLVCRRWGPKNCPVDEGQGQTAHPIQQSSHCHQLESVKPTVKRLESRWRIRADDYFGHGYQESWFQD